MNNRASLNPANELDTLHLKAASDPGAREGFWRSLLAADVWVVASQESDEDLVLHTWGKESEETAAAFTSYEALKEVMEPETYWVQVDASVIFESMVNEGLGVFINPRYQCQTRLRAAELAALVAGQFSEVRGSET